MDIQKIQQYKSAFDLIVSKYGMHVNCNKC